MGARHVHIRKLGVGVVSLALGLSLCAGGAVAEIVAAPAASAATNCTPAPPYPPHPTGVFLNGSRFVRGATVVGKAYGFCNPDTLYAEILIRAGDGSWHLVCDPANRSVCEHLGHEYTHGTGTFQWAIP